MKHSLLIFCLWSILLGCLDTATDPRPGPIIDTDAETFDVRPPITSNNTGSGYGSSGAHQSGAYGEIPSQDDIDTTSIDMGLDAEFFEDGGVASGENDSDDTDD